MLGNCARCERNLVFWCQYGIYWCDNAATVHAEQSAISHAWLSGEKALAAITVNYTPCGHCRQFMNELNSGLDLRIHLPGREAHALRDYLPDAFGPKDLEIKRC